MGILIKLRDKYKDENIQNEITSGKRNDVKLINMNNKKKNIVTILTYPGYVTDRDQQNVK